MKQTAVEWLEDYIDKEINKYRMQPMDLNAIHSLNHIKHFAFEQAKEMEKQQQGYSEEDLEKAFKVGFTLGYVGDTLIAEKDKCFNRWFKIFKNK